MKTSLSIGLPLFLALGLAACGSNPTGEVPSPSPDAAVTADVAASVTPDSAVAVADPFVWVVVQDTEQKACTTNGPGADIDAVALWGTTAALGWGKIGSANYTANPLGNSCDNADCKGGDCKYAAISNTFIADDLVAYTEGPKDATVSATTDDFGYFSLNGGTLQIQIGDLDGSGAAKEIKPGDKIKVFEVDQTYITSGDAPTSCACLPEHYTVSLQSAKGAVVDLKPTTLDPDNATCAALTAASVDGCGTTVFVVP